MPKATRWSNCTAQHEVGSFCDAPTVPGAPFPICFRHAAQIYSFIRDRMDEVGNDFDRAMDALNAARSTRATRSVRADRPAVVYYLRVGQLIKIGTTRNLTKRLREYPPGTVVLVTEPGGHIAEAERLRQFEPFLHYGREWFRPAPPLLAHIEELRRTRRSRKPAA